MENNEKKKNGIYMILDTSFFIKLQSINFIDNNYYYTTQYIINEIKDKKAREFYELKKNFIEIKNPSKDSMRVVSEFAKESNDLIYLSIADLSIMALAYETICKIGDKNLLNKKPLNYNIIDKDKLMKEIKSKKNEEKEKDAIMMEEDDDSDWITPENLEVKLAEIKGIHEKKEKATPNKKMECDEEDEEEDEEEEDEKEESENKKSDKKTDNTKNIRVYVNTGDFTLQNVCMKMGIPIMGVDGLQIKHIKNYILKCTVCSKFIFDVSRQFCDHCGYPYLMKIGYNIYSNGEIQINDKKPEPRKRGTNFDLPGPTNTKKGVVYVLAEDQLPKKNINNNIMDIDKILENYGNMKELNKHEDNTHFGAGKINSTKEYRWGYPKVNPNIAKKYHNKKKKKDK